MSLSVKIGGDASQFRRELKSVKSSASKLSGSLKSSLGGIGGALGVGLGTGALVSYGSAAIDAADAIGKGAARTSMAVDQYQQLSLMAAQAGASIISVESSVKKMTRVIRDASQGLTTGTRVMDAFGFSAKEFEGLGTHKAFEKIVNAIRAVDDPIQRLALAQEAFGRGATQLMPMIMDYDALKESISGVKLMTEKNIRAAEAYNDSMGRFKTTIQSTVVNTGFLTYLSDLADALDVVASSGDAAAHILNAMAEMVMGPEAREMSGAASSGDVKRFQKSSQEERDRRRQESEQKDKAKANAQREKDAADAAAMKKALGVFDEAPEFEDDKAIDRLKEMEHAIQLQELKNKGLEREAEILDEIYRFEKRNGKLSDEDRKALEERAGKLYDLKKPIEEMDMTETPEWRRERAAGATSLERIGAVLGGGAMTSDMTIQKAMKSLSEKQLKVQEKILEKTGNNLTLTEA